MADDLTEGLTPGGEPPSPPPPTARAEPPPEDSTPTFVRNTIVMSTGTAISRLTGFLRLSAMAFAIGITETRLADAYNVANITPNILYELALGGILTSVVVPVVVEWMQSRGREVAWDVVRRLFTIAIVALSAIALLGIVLAPWIVDLYTVGYPDAQREAVHGLATFFLRWFMPQVVFYGIGAVAAGLLNAHRRFAAPMFAPIANNVIVIATFLTFAAIAPEDPTELATDAQRLVLAIGTTLGVVAMTAALWPSVRATGFRFRWVGGIRDEAIGRIGRLATWVVVYVVANQLGYLVIVILAGGPTGGYSSYAAAFILFQLPHAIFAVSILTALLPAMSSRWAAEDLDGYQALLSQGIRATATILIPAALGYLVLAKPIVRLLLEHGETERRERRARLRGAVRLRDRAVRVLGVPVPAPGLVRDAGHPDARARERRRGGRERARRSPLLLRAGSRRPRSRARSRRLVRVRLERAAAADPPAHRPDRRTQDPRVARPDPRGRARDRGGGLARGRGVRAVARDDDARHADGAGARRGGGGARRVHRVRGRAADRGGRPGAAAGGRALAMTPGPSRADPFRHAPFRDERGLVGKILLVWLLVAAVIVVGAIDAGSILLTRSRAADLAKDASVSAAEALRQGGDEEQAKLAALDTIADADEPVRLKRIDVGRREVTVVLVVRADTLVVGRIPFLDDLERVTVSGSTSAPRD